MVRNPCHLISSLAAATGWRLSHEGRFPTCPKNLGLAGELMRQLRSHQVPVKSAGRIVLDHYGRSKNALTLLLQVIAGFSK